jgi:oxygen-independent coproporphyrinogen-3 oxidase
MKNLYIHIPFCYSLCSYCTFSRKKLQNPEELNHYVDVLCTEIEQRAKGEEIESVYFGGGTPSLLSYAHLFRIFSVLSRVYKISKKTEIHIECHPMMINKNTVEMFQKVGITRISVGIQTFLSQYDDFLGRPSFAVFRALEVLASSSFVWGADMIFGFEGQTEEELFSDLETFYRYNPFFMSCYALDYKKGAVLEEKKSSRLEFSLLESFHKNIVAFQEKKGRPQYEIYNYARKGYESVHNLSFWNGNEYRGHGAGAFSYENSVIRKNTSDISVYETSFLYEEEILSKKDQAFLFLEQQLRLCSGVSCQKCQEKFPEINWEEIFFYLSSFSSFIEVLPNNCLRLTLEGQMNVAEMLEECVFNVNGEF